MDVRLTAPVTEMGYCQCLRPYNPVHTVYMNVMFLHFSFTCVTCYLTHIGRRVFLGGQPRPATHGSRAVAFPKNFGTPYVRACDRTNSNQILHDLTVFRKTTPSADTGYGQTLSDFNNFWQTYR